MITLEDLAGYASLLTAMLAAMSYGWRWHTTPARKRFSRFIDVLDAAILIVATAAAGVSLWNTMRGHLESVILAAFLAFGISLAAVVLSGLAVFAIKEKRTGPHSAG